MFKYFVVCWVVVVKHVLNGIGNAFLNVAGYFQHYQNQLEARAAAELPHPPPPVQVYPKPEEMN